GLDGGGYAFGRRAPIRLRDRDDHVELALRRAVEDLGEQASLGREVAVQRADRQSRPGRDLLHSSGAVATRGHLLKRGGDDTLTCGGLAGLGAPRGAIGHERKK